MTVPPSSGWPDEPPRQPQYGPLTGHQPYAGQQPYAPQAHWPQQPTPPPPQKGGGAIKWLLVAIAVLLVIGVTISATLLFTRSDGGGPSSPPTSGNASDLASANDTGPVSIITEEPTCDRYMTINDSIARTQGQGWGDIRAQLGRKDEWTPDQNMLVDDVTTAMSNASQQMSDLYDRTPHRVIRELYGQFRAYADAYALSVPTYRPSDNELATANVAIGNALAAICTTIDNGSSGRSINIGAAAETPDLSQPAAYGTVDRFVSEADPNCARWITGEQRLDEELSDWSRLDTGKSATEWTPLERNIQESAVELLQNYANDIEGVAASSGNSVLTDLGFLSALYIRAYVAASPTYTEADSWLSSAGLRVSNVITESCRATSG
ncbi:hypothetical protein [Mycolicibacterium grossiae]|uniref:hypothetical protein n=1 Tax=Mycolicibacterium grossiae TaxID=1552759 RepID=UPI000F78B48B|nr:hypothetical protein [Mycolicibacterium grossiae]QEM44334.1 hypothetical protein FZ046_05665 [Mycolicibacterium grossiae]